jgi:hypothetical protein
LAWTGPGFPPVGEGEGEEEDFEVSPAALRVLEESTRLADRVARRLMELREMLSGAAGERLEAIIRRGRLGFERAPPGAAVDSTFPIDGGLDLVGGHLVVVVAGYVGFSGACGGGGRCSEAYARAWLVDSEEARRQVPLRAKLLEKALARRLLDGREAARPRLLLVDGEVVPYQLLFKPPSAVRRSRLLSRLDEATAALLEEAREKRVTIVGVVKRSYSRLLSVVAGRRLPLNDKAVMSLLLGGGDYAVAGSFGELLPGYAEMIAAEKGLDPSKYRRAVEARLGERPLYRDVVVAFYRPTRPLRGGYAVRVEVLDYGGLGLERVLSMLNGLTSPATGLPYPVDLVDEYTRLEARVLELLRRRVVAHLAELLRGEGVRVLSVLAHTNPEKRYVYEGRRRA